MNSDDIHPIVIKELRQGLKSRFFLICFLALQLAMVISMFSYIVAAVGPSGDVTGADVLVWFLLCLLFFQLMPLRGFQALYDEISGETLELLLVSRMTPRNILYGKWMGLVIQAALILSALLPYFVLRYFLGSIHIVHDLYKLVGVLLYSVVMTSIAVGFSFIKSKLVRTLFYLAGAFFNWLLSIFFMGMLHYGGNLTASGGPSFASLWTIFWTLIGSFMVIAFFLEVGASRIAPKEPYYAR